MNTFKLLFESIGSFVETCTIHGLPHSRILDHFSNKENLFLALSKTDFDFFTRGRLYLKDEIKKEELLSDFLLRNDMLLSNREEREKEIQSKLPLSEIVKFPSCNGLWKPTLFISEEKLTKEEVLSIARKRGCEVANLDHLVIFAKNYEGFFLGLNIECFNEELVFHLNMNNTNYSSTVYLYKIDEKTQFIKGTKFLFVEFQREI